MSAARRVVEGFYRELDAGDLDAAMEHIAPDVDFASSPTMPWGRRVEGRRGKEPVREYLTMLGEALDVTVRIDDVLDAERDHVVVRGVIGGRARATGASLDVRFAHLFRVDDGKIAWHRGFPDTAAVLAAMGEQPTAADERQS